MTYQDLTKELRNLANKVEETSVSERKLSLRILSQFCRYHNKLVESIWAESLKD